MPALLAIVLAQTVASAGVVSASDRVVKDAIGMWRISSTAASGKPMVAISSDGTRIAAILSRGVISSGVTEYEVRVFDLSRSAPTPTVSAQTVVFRRATLGNPPAITAVRWFQDGQSLSLLAIPDSASPQAHQLYVVDTRTRTAVQRTTASAPIVAYGMSADGETMVYATRVAADPFERDQARLRGVVADPEQPGFLFDTGAPYSHDYEVFLQRGRSAAEALYRSRAGKRLQPIEFFDRSGFIQVSPDGRHAVVGMHLLDSIPARWRGYQAALIRDFLDVREHAPPTNVLIDLTTKKVSLLVDAPSVWGGTAAAWSPDGRYVFATGYLPLDPSDSVAARSARSAGGVIEVDMASGRTRLVTDGVWQLAHVSARGDTLSLTRQGQRGSAAGAGRTGVSARTFIRDAAGWRMADSTEYAFDLFHTWGAVTATDRLVVGVNETLDSAPELAVMDRRTGGGAVITSLNPGLATLPRGAIRRVDWTSARGDAWEAHLVTPVGFKEGTRYPAVVMIMDMSYRDSYVLDGRMYKSAYPVQALANRGFVVLMTYFPPVFFEEYVKPAEREIILTGTDGAFEYLVREGLADSTRIAITGFSHAGYVTQYAITHSAHRYAAAVAMDNFNASYVSYIIFNYVSTMNAMEEFYGGNPFGPGLSEWQKEAPGFASAKVRTPLMLEVHGSGRLGETPTSNIASWESYAALSRLGKPVELVRYAYGQHILEKPIEQYSAARRQIDWLTFWLNGEVDPSPDKRNQYRRWQAMRDAAPAAAPARP